MPDNVLDACASLICSLTSEFNLLNFLWSGGNSGSEHLTNACLIALTYNSIYFIKKLDDRKILHCTVTMNRPCQVQETSTDCIKLLSQVYNNSLTTINIDLVPWL